jgi:hypothetical protein
MKSSIILLLIVFASLCGCKKDSQTPTGPSEDENLIVNSSFEMVGIPSYQGWQFWSNVQSSPAFSDDVPSAGGKWSIVLSVGDRIGANLQTKVAAPVGGNRYKLSVWAKSKGDPGFAQLILNKAIRRTIDIQNSVWRYYEVTDSLVTVKGDSLVVLLDAGTTYSSAQSFFDLCRLETVK